MIIICLSFPLWYRQRHLWCRNHLRLEEKSLKNFKNAFVLVLKVTQIVWKGDKRPLQGILLSVSFSMGFISCCVCYVKYLQKLKIQMINYCSPCYAGNTHCSGNALFSGILFFNIFCCMKVLYSKVVVHCTSCFSGVDFVLSN